MVKTNKEALKSTFEFFKPLLIVLSFIGLVIGIIFGSIYLAQEYHWGFYLIPIIAVFIAIFSSEKYITNE